MIDKEKDSKTDASIGCAGLLDLARMPAANDVRRAERRLI